jgi:hypothetical protein
VQCGCLWRPHVRWAVQGVSRSMRSNELIFWIQDSIVSSGRWPAGLMCLDYGDIAGVIPYHEEYCKQANFFLCL